MIPLGEPYLANQRQPETRRQIYLVSINNQTVYHGCPYGDPRSVQQSVYGVVQRRWSTSVGRCTASYNVGGPRSSVYGIVQCRWSVSVVYAVGAGRCSVSVVYAVVAGQCTESVSAPCCTPSGVLMSVILLVFVGRSPVGVVRREQAHPGRAGQGITCSHAVQQPLRHGLRCLVVLPELPNRAALWSEV